MPKSDRDNQRQKFYDFEDNLYDFPFRKTEFGPDELVLSAQIVFANAKLDPAWIVDDAEYAEHQYKSRIIVSKARADANKATAYYYNVPDSRGSGYLTSIKVPLKMMNFHTVLHELAHAVSPAHQHDGTYVGVYAILQAAQPWGIPEEKFVALAKSVGLRVHLTRARKLINAFKRRPS